MKARRALVRLWTVLLAMIALPGHGAEVRSFTLERVGNGFSIEFVAVVAVAPAAVHRLLTDFRRWPEISPVVTSSAVGPGLGGTTILDTQLRLCLWLACFRRDKVSMVVVSQPWQVEMRAVEGVGDFRRYDESVTFSAVAEGTLIHYRAEVEPRFYVPARIGTWFLQRTLGRALEQTVVRIETLAGGG